MNIRFMRNLLGAGALVACSSDPAPGADPSPRPPDVVDPVDGGGRDGAAAPTGSADAAGPPPWDGLGIHPGEQPLSTHGGTYPRAAQLAGGTILLGWDSAAGGDLAIRIASSTDLGATWSERGIVAQHPSGNGRTVGNVFPIASDDGSVLCAFRHHSQEGPSYVHRLLVSRSTTAGASFVFHSEIEVGANGTWEPFLHRPSAGALDVYYAREKVNGGDQDIVARRSTDAGKTWGARRVVATQSGSRDGMPSVAKLADGSLIAVFESFRSPGTPKFVVRTVQSNDGGISWSKRRDLYVPPNAQKNAGAPYIVALTDGRLVASFMTDEDSAAQAWPGHAAVKIIGSKAAPSFDSVAWDTSTLQTAVAAPAYWPALFVAANDDVLVLFDKAGPKARRAHWY